MARIAKFTTAQLWGFSIVGGLIGLAIGFLAIRSARVVTNPPVIVIGGSIEGKTSNGAGWSQSGCGLTGTLEYCVPNGGPGDTDFLASYLYNPAINNPTIQTGQSWTIRITSKNSSNPKSGVELCGNMTCSPTSVSDQKYFYIKTFDDDKSHSGWSCNGQSNCSGQSEISYVDKTCGKPGKCEHPDQAILTIGSSPPSTSVCVPQNEVGCYVSAGAPTTKQQ